MHSNGVDLTKLLLKLAADQYINSYGAHLCYVCSGGDKATIQLITSFYGGFLFSLRMQSEEEPDVVLVKVEEGTRQTSLSIQEGELVLTT